MEHISEEEVFDPWLRIFDQRHYIGTFIMLPGLSTPEGTIWCFTMEILRRFLKIQFTISEKASAKKISYYKVFLTFFLHLKTGVFKYTKPKSQTFASSHLFI